MPSACGSRGGGWGAFSYFSAATPGQFRHRPDQGLPWPPTSKSPRSQCLFYQPEWTALDLNNTLSVVKTECDDPSEGTVLGTRAGPAFYENLSHLGEGATGVGTARTLQNTSHARSPPQRRVTPCQKSRVTKRENQNIYGEFTGYHVLSACVASLHCSSTL